MTASEPDAAKVAAQPERRAARRDDGRLGFAEAIVPGLLGLFAPFQAKPGVGPWDSSLDAPNVSVGLGYTQGAPQPP